MVKCESCLSKGQAEIFMPNDSSTNLCTAYHPVHLYSHLNWFDNLIIIIGMIIRLVKILIIIIILVMIVIVIVMIIN